MSGRQLAHKLLKQLPLGRPGAEAQGCARACEQAGAWRHAARRRRARRREVAESESRLEGKEVEFGCGIDEEVPEVARYTSRRSLAEPGI